MAKKVRVSREERAKRNAEVKEAVAKGMSIKEVAKKFKLSEIWVGRLSVGSKPKVEKVAKVKAVKAPKAAKVKKEKAPKVTKTTVKEAEVPEQSEGVDVPPETPSAPVVTGTGEPTI